MTQHFWVSTKGFLNGKKEQSILNVAVSFLQCAKFIEKPLDY